jgi:hypothetical protein
MKCLFGSFQPYGVKFINQSISCDWLWNPVDSVINEYVYNIDYPPCFGLIINTGIEIKFNNRIGVLAEVSTTYFEAVFPNKFDFSYMSPSNFWYPRSFTNIAPKIGVRIKL